MIEPGKRIAVIGCGVAGLTAAWLLARKHEVHCFERNDYAGGHTRTLTIPDGADSGLQVDTGFIVMNHRNYPLFTRVLEQLGVELQDSTMSFSYLDERTGYAYSGEGFGTIFPEAGYFLKPTHWQMLLDIKRFGKVGYEDLQSGYVKGKALGEYLDSRNFCQAFKDQYMYPMGAAIWSSPLSDMADFPAEPYLHFFENHGLLRLHNRPMWRVVKGGSKMYVTRMLADFKNQPQLSSPPASIQRENGQVRLKFTDREDALFDHVIIGAHADEALKLLGDPSAEEQRLLGAWRYQDNEVVLHTDDSILPKHRKLWSAWNFTREPENVDNSPVSVSYYMNLLQGFKASRSYLVTLNRRGTIPEESIINRTRLTHPYYNKEAMATQPQLGQLNGERNTWFCGSYFGYGFHEDAVRSAVNVAKGFGIEL